MAAFSIISHASAFIIVTLGLCSIPGGGWEFFSSPPRQEWLWGPASLLSYGY